MNSKTIRLIRLICGIICMAAGIITIIEGMNIQGTSAFVYFGILFTALGAIFIALSSVNPGKKSNTPK